MLYFYYGENLFTLEEKLNIFKQRYLEKFSSGINFGQVDLTLDTLDKIRDFVETHSMFSEKKLLFVRDIFHLKKDKWEELKSIIKKNDLIKTDDIVVVFYEKKQKEELEKKSRAIFSWLGKNTKTEEFKNLVGTRFLSWLKKKASLRGAKISDPALTNLVERTKGDTLRAIGELEKLILFKGASPIEKEDVIRMVNQELETNVFKTIDALSKKDTPAALRNLKDHWYCGDDPVALLGMFVYELRILTILKELKEKGGDIDQVQKEFRLHPYVIKKNTLAAQKFSLKELAKMYRLLSQADFYIKVGKKEPQDALEDFVYNCSL